jgi:hypothetical protein
MLVLSLSYRYLPVFPQEKELNAKPRMAAPVEQKDDAEATATA